MKLNTQTREVETGGLTEVASFNIAVNGKAFRILLDGLYADKPLAIIRELCTNAYDAHLAAGKGSLPFKVILPTILDPRLVIRDFGISMSHEQVMTRFNTLFDSTKDASNNQVGAFGLGSKSPFSKVDTYTVIAWLDGEKRVYSAFIDSNGVPTIALLHREPSTEATGIEISMTVAPQDISTFRQKALDVLRWFPTQPILETTAGEKIKFPEMKTTLSGTGWHLLEDYNAFNLRGVAVRQGCVVYPVDQRALNNLSVEHQHLLNSALLIDFPIGTLSVSASREALSYDDTTCRNIVARLNSIGKELIDKFAKEVTTAPTLWEAGARRNKLASSNVPLTLRRMVDKIQWNGQDLGPMPWKTIRDIPGVEETYNVDLSRARNNQKITLDSSWRAIDRYASDQIQIGRGLTRIVFKLKDSVIKHLPYRLKEATIFDDNGTKVTGSLYVFVVDDAKTADKVVKTLGFPPDVVWAEALPEPTNLPTASARRTTGKTKVTQIKARQVVFDTNTSTYAWSDVKNVDLSGDAYHMITTNSRVVSTITQADLWEMDRYSLSQMMKVLVDEKLIDFAVPIYWISAVYEKRVMDYGKWTPFIDTVAPKIKPHFEAAILAEWKEISVTHVARSSWGMKILWNNEFRKYVESPTAGVALKEALDLFKEYDTVNTVQRAGNKHYSQKERSMSQLQPLFHSVIRSISTQTNAEAEKHRATFRAKVDRVEKAVHANYPMLRYVNGLGENLPREVLQYIEAIDQLNTPSTRKIAVAA